MALYRIVGPDGTQSEPVDEAEILRRLVHNRVRLSTAVVEHLTGEVKVVSQILGPEPKELPEVAEEPPGPGAPGRSGETTIADSRLEDGLREPPAPPPPRLKSPALRKLPPPPEAAPAEPEFPPMPPESAAPEPVELSEPAPAAFFAPPTAPAAPQAPHGFAASVARAPACAARSLEFVGTGSSLVFLQLLRLAFAAAALASLAGCLLLFAADAVARVARAAEAADVVSELETLRSRIPGDFQEPVFVFGFAASVLAFLMLSRSIRLFRIRRRRVFGAPLNYWGGCVMPLVHAFLWWLLLAITAGLAFPWVVAMKHRDHYKSCYVVGRSGQSLDFAGTGIQVLVNMILSFLLALLIVPTLGFAAVGIHWVWLRWEQENLLVPDAEGRLHRVVFRGGFWDHALHGLLQGILIVLTLGLYYPWAACATWRWLDEQTEVV
jgi:hypothetical protein